MNTKDVSQISQIIEKAFDETQEGSLSFKDSKVKESVFHSIDLLDRGEIRVASPLNGGWQVNEWVKKAILLYFRFKDMKLLLSGDIEYWDKIPLKKDFEEKKVRVVPTAVARYGSHLEAGVILMPSFVNIGAYVAEGSMVDTWATVGSCAQVGKGVHISGGVGIGGVLEPPQAAPVIIEDDVFLGSRVIAVEGVRVCKGAVLGSGVILTASTKIVDVSGEEERVFKGEIPENSVVIPGSIPKKFNAGVYHTPCAMIIGKRKESTDKKTSLNYALREFQVSV